MIPEIIKTYAIHIAKNGSGWYSDERDYIRARDSALKAIKEYKEYKAAYLLNNKGKTEAQLWLEANGIDYKTQSDAL